MRSTLLSSQCILKKYLYLRLYKIKYNIQCTFSKYKKFFIGMKQSENEIVKLLLAVLFKTGGASDTTLRSRVPIRKVLPKRNRAVHKRGFFLSYR